MPRAPADSGASAGLALSGLGDASSAVLGPRRGDVPVAGEGPERSAPPVYTPGVGPGPYDPPRRLWGKSAPRRPFRPVVRTTFKQHSRDVDAPK